MAGVTIGTAVIVIEADGSDFVKDLESKLGKQGVAAGDKAGKETGWSFARGVAANLTSNLITKAASSVGNLFSSAFSKGFGRLVAIDDARGSLRGLGHDAETIDQIMTSALNSVKGTAFGLGDAATIAATAVASGIKPGEELTNRLKLTGDAATIARVSLDEMGSIFGKVQTGQKAYTAELNQLADRGIPIYQWLQEELGVSAASLRKMVAAGEIDSARFFSVIQKNIGGAALEAGTTFSGSLQNVGAALGRVGAAFMEPVFERMPSVFAGLIDVFDKLSPAAEAVGTALGSAFADVVTAVADLGPKLEAAAGFVERHQVAFTIAAGVITTLFIPAMIRAGVASTVSAAQTVAAWVAKQAAAIAGAAVYVAQSWLVVGSWIRMGAQATISGAIVVGQWVAMGARAIAGAAVVVAQTAVVVAQWVAMQIAAGVSAGIQAAANARAAASFVAVRVAMLAQVAVMATVRAATIAWTAVQWLLNIALNANPLGLIVLAIGLFVGAIVLAWKNSETFRSVVMAAWNGIKAAADVVVNWFLNTALPLLKGLWDGIVAGFRWLANLVVSLVTGFVNSVVNSFNWWRETLTRIVTTIRDWVVQRWNDLRDMVVAAVAWLIDRIVTGFTNWRDNLVRIATAIKDWIVDRFDQLRDAAVRLFERMVDGIGRIWDGLKAIAKAPVKFVIETVLNDGLISGWNWVVDKLKLPDNLRIAKIPLPGFWDAGILPGPGTGTGDDMVVVDRHGRARATVASGEPVLSRQMYAQNRSVVDAILAGRTLPGFFQGGTLPTPGPVRPHRMPYYNARYAADMGLGSGSPVVAWMDGVVASIQRLTTSYGHNLRVNHGDRGQSLYAHLLPGSIAVAVGQAVRAGMRIASVGYTGNVRPPGPAGAHLHFEILGGNAPIGAYADADTGGGMMAAATQWIAERMTAPVRAAIDKIPGESFITDAAKGISNKLLDEAVRAITGKVPAGDTPDGAVPFVPGRAGSVPGLAGVTGNTYAKAANIYAAAAAAGHRVSSVGGYRGDGEHVTRRALDFMVSSKPAGDWISNYVLSNRARLGLQHVIWWQAINSGDSRGWRGMADRGSWTQNHKDHPHVLFNSRDLALMDSGGWLDPGVTAVRNDSGRREPVLSSGQWANVSGILGMLREQQATESQSKRGEGATITVEYKPTIDPHAVNPRREYENFTHDFIADVEALLR